RPLRRSALTHRAERVRKLPEGLRRGARSLAFGVPCDRDPQKAVATWQSPRPDAANMGAIERGVDGESLLHRPPPRRGEAGSQCYQPDGQWEIGERPASNGDEGSNGACEPGYE